MAERAFDLIVNPSAGAGRALRVLDSVRDALTREGFSVNVHRTEGPGQAGVLMRTVLATRTSPGVVGVMGGDGTFNEALQGLHDEGTLTCPPDTTLALVPAGTGGDLRKTLEMPESPDAIARVLARATPRPFDLGRITVTGHDGRNRVSLFGNIADAGIAGTVVDVVNRRSKRLGGALSFFLGSLQVNLTYRNLPMRVKVDGTQLYEGDAFLAVVANGKAFGGGMFVAPMADPHDGLFDVVVLANLTTVQRLKLATSMRSGKHIGTPNILHMRGTRIEMEPTSDKAVLIDMDGEQPGMLPATYEMLPGAVKILRG